MLPTIKWDKDKVIMIDQRKLPEEEIYVEARDYNQVAEAIEKMIIRGAPAIGVAAAYGIALGVLKVQKKENIAEKFLQVCERFEKTRPTARNLFWALERMKHIFERSGNLPFPRLKQKLIDEATAIEKEDVETNRKIGDWGKALVEDGQSILTHCNAGELATAGYGTALGVPFFSICGVPSCLVLLCSNILSLIPMTAQNSSNIDHEFTRKSTRPPQNNVVSALSGTCMASRRL